MSEKPTRVGLLAPMTHELAPLVTMLGLEPRSDDPYTLHDATVGGVEFVATMTGIGMAAATDATHRILDDGPVDYVIVVGIAGGIEPGQEIGDGYIALDMETAAVAAVCEARGAQWTVFRSISDRPSDGLVDSTVWEMTEMDGSAD